MVISISALEKMIGKDIEVLEELNGKGRKFSGKLGKTPENDLYHKVHPFAVFFPEEQDLSSIAYIPIPLYGAILKLNGIPVIALSKYVMVPRSSGKITPEDPNYNQTLELFS